MDDCHKRQDTAKFQQHASPATEEEQALTRFRIVAVPLLLWNLAGLAAFAIQVRARPES